MGVFDKLVGNDAIDKAINSIQVSTSAIDNAKASGLSQRAKAGFGAKKMNTMLEQRIQGIVGSQNSQLAEADAKSMDLSSIGQGRINAAVSDNQSKMQGAISEIQTASDRDQMQASQQWQGLLSQQDQMELTASTQKAQLESQKTSMFDAALKVGGFAASAMSGVGALGQASALKKLADA
jgi:hypothetical protein